MSQKSSSVRQTPPRTPNSENNRRSSTPNKKPMPIFNSYMSLLQVQEQLKKGEVIEEGGMDMYIGGVLDRNAALNGDIVAIKLNPQHKWKVIYDHLDIYLEENKDLKALVYKPFDEDNTCLATQYIPATVNTNTVNTKELTVDDGQFNAINHLNPICEENEVPNEKKKKKTRRRQRGKKKGKEIKNVNDTEVENLESNITLKNDNSELSPSTIDKYSPKNVESNSIDPTLNNDYSEVTTMDKCSQKNVVVAPHELSECEDSDPESDSSLPNYDVCEELKDEFKALKINCRKNILSKLGAKKSDINDTCSTMHIDSYVEQSAETKEDKEKIKSPDKRKGNNKVKNHKENESIDKNISNKKQKDAERTIPNVFQVFRLENWEKFVQKTAKVVAIIEPKHPRVAAGILRPFNDNSPHFALFSPFDSRIPRMRIPTSTCPPDFLERPGDYSKMILLARIVVWTESKFAFGELVRNIGNVGDISAETESILLQNQVDFSPFPNEITNDLPPLPWSIPNEEYHHRKDLRQSLILTIDPSTARDLDDAVSCLRLPSGNFRIGIHIADVSYFVKIDTLLDSIAANRGTTVYLVDQVVPMLPRSLSEDLCSLNPGEDRLAFSVILELTPEGKVEGQWFGRTVIRSCIKLSYDHAQTIIENPDSYQHPEQFPACVGHDLSDICKVITDLYKLSVQLRKKRIDNGALRLDQPKLSFSLHADLKTPNGLFVYEYKDSNKLIEEFMLLANISVAREIYSSFPNIALLRKHPPPHDVSMDNTINILKQNGIHLDATSSASLSTSIKNYVGDNEQSMARMSLIVNMCSKPMQYAKYFCSGALKEEGLFHHYALNEPLYTHFTSPIRRYADIMVHRILAAVVDPDRYSFPHWNSETVQKKASHCNDKKQLSKVVQEVSVELYLALFIQNVGEMIENALVVRILDKSFDVFITRLGIVKRCYVDKLPLYSYELIANIGEQKAMLLEWKEDVKHNLPPLTQKISCFLPIMVSLQPFENGDLKFNAFLLRPDYLLSNLDKTS